jgi:tyrosine-protein kinase Etk/Wzc
MESGVAGTKQVGIFDYLTVLVSYRRFIFLNLVGVCSIVAILSFLLPSWYRAQTTMLPPPEEPAFGLGMASSVLGIASGFGSSFSLPLMATPSDVYAAILRSRVVGEAVVQEEGLMQVFETKSMEKALRILFSNVSIQVTAEGLISLTYEDKDRNRAASVANRFVEEMDRINREKSTSQAKNARIFIEERLAQTEKDLSQAEEDLRRFQEENKTILLDDQMKAAIEKAADLKAQMVSAEVKMNVLSRTLSPSHPQVRSLRSEIREIKNQLEILESGNESEDLEGKTILDVPFTQVPSLSLKLARLMREVKIQESVFELLTQQYEQYRIQETKDTPTVQVLDRAVPPEKRARPRRAILVIISGLLSLFTTTVFVFGLEYFKRAKQKDPEALARLESLLGAWRKDMEDVKRRLLLKRRRQ